MILGAYREAELDRAHPLQKSLVEWNRERLATRVPLGRLTIEATSAMLAVMFGQEEISSDFARALFQETEGNPFFVEEVVKALIEQGQIYREEGEWQRQDVAELAIPQSIKAAVSRRLDRLSEGCTQALQAAAALGKSFEFRELAAVATLAEDPLLDALDEAAAAQLVRSEGGEKFVFTHDKIREVLHEELNPIRQRRLHQRIGESLEKLHAGDIEAHVQDLAFHFAASGDLKKGLDYSLRAGEKAERLYVLEDALRSYDRARECAEALEDGETLGRVEEKLGDVYGEIGDLAPATAHYERALGLARAQERRASVECKIGEVYARLADARGVAYLERAMAAIDQDRNPADMARALGTLGRYHHHHGKHHEAIELLQRARELAERSGKPELITLVLGYLAGAHQHLTEFGESDRWARRAIEFGEQNDYKSAIAIGYEFMAENANARGLWRDSLRYGMLDREWGEKIQSQERQVWSRFTVSWALHATGELARARAEADAGIADAGRIGESRVARFLNIQLVEILSDLGEEDAAWSLAEKVYADATSSGMIVHRAEGHRLYASLHLRRGEWAEARARAKAAMEVVRGTDQKIAPLIAATVLAEACARTGDAAAAAAIADVFDRARTAGSPHAEGLAWRAQGLLASATGDAAGAEEGLGRAIAIFEEGGTRIELARTLRDRASSRAARGNLEGARADLSRSLQLAEECGAAPDVARAAAALRELSPSAS